MRDGSKLSWLLAAESAIMLVLPFPVAGPLPHWRAELAYIALVPLLITLLFRRRGFGWSRVARNTVVGYFGGVLWYAGTCYWIQSTMHLYGSMSSPMSWLVLFLFCLFLGLYFALFALLLSLAQRATENTALTLVTAPFLWVAMELACARITSFPWNQLGYSQIDNLLLTRLAPWTGTYGISFWIVSVNCAIACFFLLRSWRARLIPMFVALGMIAVLHRGFTDSVPQSPAPRSAELLQPNLDVGAENGWTSHEFDVEMQKFTMLSENGCKPYYKGLPTVHISLVHPQCMPSRPVIDLIVWPESPAPFIDSDPRFRHWVSALAEDAHAPMIVDDIAIVRSDTRQAVYNSAAFIAPDGTFVGHYNKMHLVPFGEYVPFRKMFSFAGSLTTAVGQLNHGRRRLAFAARGHSYGSFICYESIFADEVRQFAKLGADVLVNVSDDGWYGDTSAPWQHLNMARMRAIENDRWLLRDTNSGVTAVIDPYGRVLQSSPRHVQTSLLAHFNYVEAKTFYTVHGDLFAWLCAIIAIVLAVDGTLQNNYRGA